MVLTEMPAIARACSFNQDLHDPRWVQVWKEDRYLFTVLAKEAATLLIAGFDLRASPKTPQ